MNKIHTPGTNPQDETITPQKEVITWNTWSAIEQSLSETPLTTDEKINQLTDDVHNLNNGLKELIELSKILVRWQIEGTNAMMPFIQSMGKFMHDIRSDISWISTEIESIDKSLDIKIAQSTKSIIDTQTVLDKKIIRNQKTIAKWIIPLLYSSHNGSFAESLLGQIES